jgi:rubrerythrin
MIARREFYPNTAQYTKSLYTHAAARFMEAPMATPATANFILMIQESDILKYGTSEGQVHKFVLDDTFVAYVDDIPFMLDYPINILTVRRENGKYAHTTHYDFYINNSLSTTTDRYLPNKVINYKGTEYLLISATMRQIAKSYANQLVTSNTIVNTVTMDFTFEGDLANFEVFYQQDDNSARVQLEKRLKDAGTSKNPFCWYTIVDDSTIRLTFPANAYFMPRLNSVISIEIATSLGEEGNFDTYDSDIVSENASTRYPYNTQVPVFGTVDGASTGGAELISTEEFRSSVMRAYCTNRTYITTNDLQLYFDQLMTGTSDRFKFTRKRDDSFIRLYGAFLLMKDSGGNVIPTNTLDIELDPLQDQEDFDLYSDAVHRFIIRPGSLFTYAHSEDDSYKYILKRIHGKRLSDDLDAYDYNKGFWRCTQCGETFESTESLTVKVDDEDHIQCPHCEAMDSLVQEKYVFTNPYLISVSTDNFMAGYFLNSVSDHYDLSYTAANDVSIVQFIARHFKVERNAISGENFYRFSVALSPSVEVDETTLYEERNERITALHNGYVDKIEHDGDNVVAIITYTDDPTMEELPEDELTQAIQVSSSVAKVDQYFYVCPSCGHRMSVEEYEALVPDGLVNEEGNELPCPHCPNGEATLSSYTKQYVDYDYTPGYDLQFTVGESITKGDVIATAKPKDSGRIRVMMDLGDIMSSGAHRYIPMTMEEAHNDDGVQYYLYAAYLSTNDMIDSKHIMSIDTGYVMTDGSSGKNHSLSIPIEGLSMNLHVFYEYREDDDLDDEVRNPAHSYSSYNYAVGRTFTNSYSLKAKETITLIRPLDNAKGFLDAIERPQETTDEPVDDTPVTLPDDYPELPTYSEHPEGEEDEVTEDPDNTIFLRTLDHERFLVDEPTDDRIEGYHLTVDKIASGYSYSSGTTSNSSNSSNANDGIATLSLDDEEETGISIQSDEVEIEDTNDSEDAYLKTKASEYMAVEDGDDDQYLTVEGESSGSTEQPEEPDVDPEESTEEPDDSSEELPEPSYPETVGVYGSNFLFRLRNCPVVSANWIKDGTNEHYFIEHITDHYNEIDEVLAALEESFSIDMKYYNSYGKSKFYMVGNGSRTSLETLDSVNVTLSFGIALNFPASADVFVEDFRNFVQDYIEATNEMVGNGIDLYILNLIAAAKSQFDEIIYMEYYGLNDYDYAAQRLIIMSDDEILQTVAPDSFVPEFLNIVRVYESGGSHPDIKIAILDENLS